MRRDEDIVTRERAGTGAGAGIGAVAEGRR